MSGQERKKKIVEYVSNDENPVSASILAKICGVSRQVIVQDIALLRASGYNIIATNRGYVMDNKPLVSRVFKVKHTDDELQSELYGVVDMGGEIADVFINHKAYGQVRAILNISSRKKADDFIEKIRTGKSSPLKNITSDYHYHTITAENEEILNEIEMLLKEKGFLIEKMRNKD